MQYKAIINNIHSWNSSFLVDSFLLSLYEYHHKLTTSQF